MKNNQNRAFTLVELLVVIAIIAILASLLFPMFQGMAIKKNEVAGANNMRQVGMAFMLFSGENNYQLPGRVPDGGHGTPKWPAALAGMDGSEEGIPLGTNYLKDVRLYAAAGDTAVDLNHANLNGWLTSRASNRTSWLMNGYNDIMSPHDPSIDPTQVSTAPINVNGFDHAPDTILLGMLNHPRSDFFMDLDNNDNAQQGGAIRFTAYGTGINAGSLYLFQDGSVRFIKQSEYMGPAPTGSGYYGDWLWLAHKPQ